jgi:60 kDa SS-A/Ro ribonucleoprotein
MESALHLWDLGRAESFQTGTNETTRSARRSEDNLGLNQQRGINNLILSFVLSRKGRSVPSKAIKAHFDTLNQPVPQTKQADPAQAPNNAGGFSFVVSDRNRLLRFLMLGSDGGTYYVSEKKLTEQNVDFLVDLIKRDPELVLNTTVEVSHSGRAYRNSSAIFVMSLLFKHAPETAKPGIRAEFGKVVRTSTHLFEFAEYVELMGGWGAAKRKAVAQWYTSKSPDQLAYQSVKYRQRDGWTHRDLFRLAHPKGVDQQVGNFILKGSVTTESESPEILGGFKRAQAALNISAVTDTLDMHKNLPWEAVPTQFHKSPELWKKLFENGQLQGQALLRQITRLARLGMFKDMVFAREYANLLVDEEMIAKTRLHPIQYLLALVGHTEGQVNNGGTAARFGFRSNDVRSKDWTVSPIIRDALDQGFYASFKYVEPANKRTFIGLDVSSSMSALAMGIGLSCAQVGAAMAMTIARTEPYYEIRGFTAGPVASTRNFRSFRNRSENGLHDLGISATTSLPDALKKVQAINFGSTDCSLPMECALENDIPVDTFVVITDNETYEGKRHPHKALQEYRGRSTHYDAKLIVMGMTATQFTIADSNDGGMLDIVGCDTNVPKLVADFSAGRI